MMAIIFDNDHFFCMDENGMWHQKRAEEDYAADVKAYERAVTNGKLAAKRLNK